MVELWGILDVISCVADCFLLLLFGPLILRANADFHPQDNVFYVDLLLI